MQQELNYCPKCSDSSLEFVDQKKWICKCGFTLYHNVAGAVAVLVKNNGKILFTRRNQEPGKGKLDLPGGFVDANESAEQTCKRELYEELRLNIITENLTYLSSLPNVYAYKEIEYNTLDLFFLYNLESESKLSLELNEISEIKWLLPSEIHLEEIAFLSQQKFLKKYFGI